MRTQESPANPLRGGTVQPDDGGHQIRQRRRIQKAREGRWNGGFAPYGYQLADGRLIINEEEAEAIRIIYDQYVHTDIGVNGIAKYLENHGIRKIIY